ncbi:MAG: SPL family radical SAM protein [bacterium]
MIEECAQDSRVAQNILSVFPDIHPEIIDELKIEKAKCADFDKSTLILANNKGKFLRLCPGTKEYLCCLYNFLNIGSNCPIECTYCILQAYLDCRALIIYVNQDELFKELDRTIKSDPNLIRIGTGELTDSLALDPLSGISEGLITFFSGQKQAFLELKTKSNHIDHLLQCEMFDQIIMSWSLNPQTIVEEEEHGAASIEERLRAARKCQQMGIKIGFHFDPILLYHGWEEAYHELIRTLCDYIDISRTVWISMGCFRFMPHLKPIIQKRFPQSMIIYQEFIPGLDHKMRYLQPMRIKAYQSMASWIWQQSKEAFIYLCMESPIVWKEALGYAPKDNETLKSWLDRRCYLHTIIDNFPK